MWAVGRLSLLSRGLHALRPVVAPDPEPAVPPAPPVLQKEAIPATPPVVVAAPAEVPAPVVAAPAEVPPSVVRVTEPVKARVPSVTVPPGLVTPAADPVRHQILHESAPSSLPAIVGVANPLPRPPAPPSLLERIVIRIKRFFRSLFR